MLLVVLAVCSGIALRSVELLNHNYVFVYDQGLDMMAARSIAVSHKLTLIGAEAGGGFAGLPGIFHGPGYHYLLAFISLFSRGDPYGEMVALWIMHIAELWIFYAIGKKLFGTWGGVTASYVAAVSPAFIGMTRVIWAPNFVGLFILLFLYVLLVRKRASVWEGAFLGLTAGFLYNFEIPLAVVALGSAAAYFIFVEHQKDVRSWAGFFIGTVVSLSPMAAFDARHGWTTVRGLVGFMLHPVAVTKGPPFDPIGHLRTLLFSINGVFPPIQNLPYWFWFVVLTVVLIYYLHRNRRSNQTNAAWGILCIVFVHVLLFVPYRNPVYGHYLTILPYAITLFMGYITASMVAAKKIWPVAIGVLITAIPALLLYPRTAVADYRDTGGTAKIRGKTAAVDEAYRESGGKPFNLLVFTPPVYTYPYDYLIQWYAAKKYGFVPGTEKRGTVILLIEPDPEKPWSYNGWLETVIKNGTVLSTTKLPSGFIIQKRQFTP